MKFAPLMTTALLLLAANAARAAANARQTTG